METNACRSGRCEASRSRGRWPRSDAFVFVDGEVERQIDDLVRHGAAEHVDAVEHSPADRLASDVDPQHGAVVLEPAGRIVGDQSERGDLDRRRQASARRAAAIADDRTESSLDQLGRIQAVGELSDLGGGLPDRFHDAADRGAVERGRRRTHEDA